MRGRFGIVAGRYLKIVDPKLVDILANLSVSVHWACSSVFGSASLLPAKLDPTCAGITQNYGNEPVRMVSQSSNLEP